MSEQKPLRPVLRAEERCQLGADVEQAFTTADTTIRRCPLSGPMPGQARRLAEQEGEGLGTGSRLSLGLGLLPGEAQRGPQKKCVHGHRDGVLGTGGNVCVNLKKSMNCPGPVWLSG